MKTYSKFLAATSITFMLAGCSLLPNHSDKGKKEQKSTPITKISSPVQYYPSATPFKEGVNRGQITSYLHSKLDIDEVELGLMELSQDEYDTDDYIYQEGQLIDNDELDDWLKRSSTTDKGLNPPIKTKKDASVDDKLKAEEDNPKYLAYVLEQDYLDKDGNVAGMSLGLVLHSTYYFKTTDSQGLIYNGSKKLSTQKAQEYGKKVAQKIVDQLRKKKDTKDLPIYFTLFQESNKGDILPGQFVSSNYIKGSGDKLGGWDDLNRKYYLFPSTAADKDQKEVAGQIGLFQDELNKYYGKSRTMPVVAKGLFVDKNLQKLSVEIPVASMSKTEIISLSQFVANMLTEGALPNHSIIEVKITALDKIRSFILFDPNEDEPFIHVYD
ncbi:CamS family sex pheromone protein [Priestia koreensis]|uniref:CamS family sex pheromone protein n=1 Tax=Priestia koreensis TaxID=284581 RepID=A0A0M0L540_9BACI|nr:CamS family sex pheromone protein [Priestia koreensis]KOO46159.1 hypothetical protein AMD01_09845 [Priestia koreensis]MCM3004203.1 CamS family sex pheromone protein [Priestia koreensis]UNL83419.1 CamS family sex pheromone protein [Priestia koreensis]